MEVDVRKTTQYYSSLSDTQLCDCAYCINYRKEIKAAYPRLVDALARLGVDIEKPYETSPLEPEEGYLTYCACQYIVFGSCRATDCWQVGSVTLRPALSYPPTGIGSPHFVLELYPIRLPLHDSDDNDAPIFERT